MSLIHTKFFRLLNIGIALVLGGLLAACLDLPNDPDTSGKIESIKVHVVQYDKVDSTTLKINPKDSSTLVASVTPHHIKDELKFYWYFEDELLDSGNVFPVNIRNSAFVPNVLQAIDKEGNSKTIDFSTTLNSAPYFDDKTFPQPNETIEASAETPVLFQWASIDSYEDELTHILEIDDVQYNVGSLTRIYQSGFTPGDHKFRVIVTDPYGDSDTLTWVSFKIKDPNVEESI